MSGARGYLIIALVLTVVILGLQSLMRPDYSRRNTEVFTEMVYSRAAESFSANQVLPGGVTQQPLVAGVVPRGALPFRFGTGPEEAQRAGRELDNPLPKGDQARLEAGRRLYGIYCTACHDPAGNGTGKVSRRGMLPPPSLHAARALQMADGEMFHILTLGQGNMASYGAQLSPEERWEVILHVRQLQEKPQ